LWVTNNVQNNSDAYFHAANVQEMYAVLQRASTDCSVKTPNNNLVPTADAGADYNIPNGTAFVLTGTGTDPNGDPLTYLWEQYDNTSNTQPPVSTERRDLCIVLCCRQLLLQDIFRC
jgi:hypothetical protein